MDMNAVIPWVVLALGALLILAGIIAVFRGAKEGSATIKITGMEISGAGGAVLVVLGAVMLFTAWAWNDEREARISTRSDLVRATVELSALEARIDSVRVAGGSDSTFASILPPRTQVLFRFSPGVERDLLVTGLSSKLPMGFFSDTQAYVAELDE